MTLTGRVICIALTLFALASSLPKALAQSEAPTRITPEIKAEALREGRVVLWSSLGGPYLETIKRQGEKTLGIAIDAQRLTSNTLVDRAAREFDGGIHEIDVILLSSADPLADFRKKGIISPFIPSSIDSYSSKEFYDPDHYWHAAYLTVSGIVYNTTVISNDLVPHTWKDLADPKYKDMLVAASPNSSGGARVWAYWWWKWFGPGYFEDLKRNNIQIETSTQTAGPFVARGERPILFADSFNYALLKNQGAPVAIVIPEGGATGIIGPVALMARAPHPAAARLLIDWLLSPESQALTTDQGVYSPIRDAKIRYPAELEDLYKDREIVTATPAEVKTWWDQLGKEKISSLFGGS